MVNPSRFNRDYRLIIQINDERAVVVRPPFRIAFSADKTDDVSLNKLNIKIYNLNPDNRAAIVKDAEDVKKLGVDLLVGYNGTVERIFKGSIHVGQNYREGADMVTSLECQDGGFDFHNSYTSKTINAGADPVLAILDDMPNTTRGKITSNRPRNTRPRVLVGNSCKLIGKTVADQAWFIDDEALNILNADEVVGEFIPIVEARSGLLNTPAREENIVTIQTLFNPSLRVRGLYELRSTTAGHLNGIYKIKSIGYDGDYDGSNWSQTVKAVAVNDYTVVP